MGSLLGKVRLPHLIAIGVIAVVLGGGLPSKWFGLISSEVNQVERLRTCLERHSVEFVSLVTSIGDAQSFLNKSHGARAHAVHVAEREGRLQRREGRAILACTRTVSR
jgi:hypothetical protein